MLAMFQLKKTFNKLSVSVWVSCEQKNASVIVTYNRVIVATQDIPFHEANTPDKANAWLARPMGERGSFVEYLEWRYRIEAQAST